MFLNSNYYQNYPYPETIHPLNESFSKTYEPAKYE